MADAYTLLPWAVDPDNREGMEWNVHIVEARRPDMRVCFMTSGPEARLNAAFIVRACNSHDALASALQDMVSNFEPFRSRPVGAPNSSARAEQDAQIAAFDKAKAALASIEGEAK